MSYKNVNFGGLWYSNGETAVIGIKTYHLGAYQYSAYEQKINSNTTLLFK